LKNLVIDIGNSSVSMCIFNNDLIIDSLKMSYKEMSERKLSILDNKINFKKFNILISSVVPLADKIFKDYFNKKLIKIFFLRDFLKKVNIKTNILNKKEIGEDRLANMIYAKKKFKKSLILIDFGTATTFDVLDKNGIYHGGVITPGIDISLNTLKSKTAKLPLVKFKKTKNVIGFSTKQAIESGFFWGYTSMIEGLVNKIKKEQNDEFSILLTGGNSNYFKNIFEKSIIDEYFILKSLNFILHEYKR
tara:strand:+ start:366 stop:1109 length:744 start_codon:yes stop_codon:yes gene_type:complete